MHLKSSISENLILEEVEEYAGGGKARLSRHKFYWKGISFTRVLLEEGRSFKA